MHKCTTRKATLLEGDLEDTLERLQLEVGVHEHRLSTTSKPPTTNRWSLFLMGTQVYNKKATLLEGDLEDTLERLQLEVGAHEHRLSTIKSTHSFFSLRFFFFSCCCDYCS